MKKILPLLLSLLLLLGCSEREPETGEPDLPEIPQASESSSQPSTLTEPSESQTEETEPSESQTEETEPQPEAFVLTFAGDTTLGSQAGVLYAPIGILKTIGEDYDYPFANLGDLFEKDDFSMVNLEGPLTDNGVQVTNKAFSFKAPQSYVNILSRNSVEAVTLANNHSLDCHLRGYEDTKAVLESAGIAYVEKDGSMLYTTASGLTIGVYAEFGTNDMDKLTAAVASMREQGAQVIIYAVHWGIESCYHPIKDQEKLAHQVIDAGVDIIFGTHPHVLQRIEHYGSGVIFYSLGNFIFGGNTDPRDKDSVVLQQQVLRWPDGRVELGELTIIPISISSIPERNNYQPTPYEEGTEEYNRVLEKLQGLW